MINIAYQIDKQSVLNQIKSMYFKQLIVRLPQDNTDDIISAYIDDAIPHVDSFTPPQSIYALLVRLWASHLMYSMINSNNVTSAHLASISIEKSNQKGNDGWLDEFNSLLNQYGLTNYRIYGF